MKLPGRERAFVPERKLTAYLLSLSHPVGRAKARFFRRLGFDGSNADRLRNELIDLAQRADVASTECTAHGTKYVVDGLLSTPSGDEAAVRTVWIIEDSRPDAPRFVTAYPA